MTSCTNTVNLPVNQDSFNWWAAIVASVPGTLNGDTGASLCSPALDCLRYTLSRGTKTRLDSSVHPPAQSSIRITSHLLPALWVWSILSYAASEFSRRVLLVWITWKKVCKNIQSDIFTQEASRKCAFRMLLRASWNRFYEKAVMKRCSNIPFRSGL